ncbi:hypothetical protein [Alkalihalobacillus sp. BA299]|uniref:hypothetical protein n=1 Tax=Alkalihalobacillus sp. BA299 TaxID=2815938 RepID=UPI001ADD2FE6|nr:hypothetical protein [Alkalihalobacillus sp. BA299]
MGNWLTYMFRSGRRTQQVMDMFGIRRDNNRNGLMLSLVGLGLGAVAYGFLRGRNGDNMNLNGLQVVPRLFGQVRNPVS